MATTRKTAAKKAAPKLEPLMNDDGKRYEYRVLIAFSDKRADNKLRLPGDVFEASSARAEEILAAGEFIERV